MKTPRRIGIGIHEAVLVLLLAGVLFAAYRKDPSFISREAQLELSTHAAELALLALPMTLVIISGGIDLAVGSTMALAGVVFGLLFEAHAPIWLSAVAALATGAAGGALNGAFVTRLGVHPLIVTLASLAAYRGLAEGISVGRPISGFPDAFQKIGTGSLLGVPAPLIIFIIAALGAHLLASRTTFGFRVYSIGGNERAAKYSGIPVDRIKLLLYTLSGTTAALAALLFAARRNTAKADMGADIELDVITAVVLGGANINGGRGRVLGTVLGVVLIHELREFVSWHWSRSEVILIVVGAILIASVLLNNLASRRRA
jgi:rhamnose transport system permease protein